MTRVSTQAIDAQERRLTALARGIRAAIVLPLLFALALLVIKRPEMAGFAVFGTFAHLVMVNYSAANGARAAESCALTMLGTVLVGLGTLFSANLWLAVAGAVIAGLLAELSALTRSHFAVIRSALLMAFMLAVAVPTPRDSLPTQLYGWLLAGLIAQPALQLVWIPVRPVGSGEEIQLARHRANSSTSLGDAVCAGSAMGLAVLVARLLGLDHAFWVVLGVAPAMTMRNLRQPVPSGVSRRGPFSDSWPASLWWRTQGHT